MPSQFLQLIETLSSREKKGFISYMESPYFNTNTRLSILAKAYVNLKTNESEASVFNPTRLGFNPSGTQRRLLTSELMQYLEAFLIQQSQSRNSAYAKARSQLTLQKLLREQRHLQRYAAANRRLNKAITQLPDGQLGARIKYEAGWESVQAKINQRSLQLSDLAELRKKHERAFTLEALRLACHAFATQTIDPGQLEPGLLPVLLEKLAASDTLIEDPATALYYYCYRMLENQENQQAFMAFKSLLPQLIDLDLKEARDLILMGINYCIRLVNTGDATAGGAALDLYTLGLEKGYLLDGGRFSRFTFNNVVALALKAGAAERAATFIDRFAALLEPEYRQSTTALNRARLAFASGDLTAAMEQLQTAKDQDVLTTLNLKILQMRVYSQLKENRLLDAHLDALDIYLRRRKDKLGYHYKAYRQLVSFARKFRRLNAFDKVAVSSFRNEVVHAKELPEREWLLSLVWIIFP